MKKIIHQPKRKIVTCPECECVFSCEDSDIEFGSSQRDYYEYTDCPYCNTKIDIYEQTRERFRREGKL